MRRSGLIAPAAVLAAAMLAPQAQAATRFKDVNQSTPHQADIVWLAGTNITTGWKDGTFRGMESVKRQDMAAFLYRLAGSPTVSGSEGFRDVDASTPHYREIVWLASTGITTGWRDGTFRGMESVRRQDMAAFLHRFASRYPDRVRVREHGGVVFRDVDSTTPHAQDVWWLSSTRVATGWKDGTFRGLNPVVRQDMAAFLHRIANPANTYGDTGGKPDTGNQNGNTSKPNTGSNGNTSKPNGNQNGGNTSKPNNGDTGNQNNSAALAEARRQLASAQASQSRAAGALRSADSRVTAARAGKAKADGDAAAAAQAKTSADTRVNAAQAALDKADRDVKTRQAAYDSAEAKAKAAREQIAKGSLGFYQTMGWQQAVDVIENKNASWDGYINGQSWYHLGADDSATSLKNMQTSVKFMRETNQIRHSLGLSELKYAPRLDALAQAAVDYNTWGTDSLQHDYSDSNQNLAAGYDDPLQGWYYAEKQTWDDAVAKNPDLSQYKNNPMDVAVNYPDLYPQVGHYLNVIQPDLTIIGEASNDSWIHAQNLAQNSFASSASAPVRTYEDVLSVDEYASKLNEYVDNLNAQVRPADDAKKALDKAKAAQQTAQTELNSAKTAQQSAATQLASAQAAQASAQKELDAAVKAQASAAKAKAQADKAVADAQRKVDSLSK